MNKSGLDLNNARKEEQIKTMKQIIADGICPFCHDFVDKEKPMYHSNPILAENDSWVATRNAWPYENTKEHLILVIKRHILLPEEMTKEEVLDLWEIVKKVKQELEITHSTLLMRSDSTGKTGATVQHLHAQLVSAGDEGIVLTRVG
ncbi:MAG: HIT domain-containing protein [Parcubacteria group bacterium]|jgi:diadenosine tetraphosphate (Ap4A) HIT family hydrolase